MISYLLYKIAKFLAIILPRKIGYILASFIAKSRFYLSKEDREAVLYNIRRVMSQASDKEIRRVSKKVFENFGKYLVDFLRFSKINEDFINRYVKIENIDFLKEALHKFKGVIALTAHLGNWELGGAIVAKLGYPLYAVALTHNYPKVNDFFNKQRALCGVRVIPVGLALKKCFKLLKRKNIVALLGDRDFRGSGLTLDFCGRKANIPRGTAIFSLRTGAPIVPAFLIRKPQDKFSLIFEKPIYPFDEGTRFKKEEDLIGEYLRVFEKYVKRYPSQWYMFQPFFKE